MGHLSRHKVIEAFNVAECKILNYTDTVGATPGDNILRFAAVR